MRTMPRTMRLAGPILLACGLMALELDLDGRASTQTSAAAADTQEARDPSPERDNGSAGRPSPYSGVPAPRDYRIGPDDVLQIVFWREENLSAEVIVRPDGKISLPLLNDVQAAGLSPDELRELVVEQAGRFVENPTATVIIKQINSRLVFITGEVGKPGPYPLRGPLRVLQLIATAGGLTEYADRNKIIILRDEEREQVAYPFFYDNVVKGKTLKQNIELRPGDTVIVP